MLPRDIRIRSPEKRPRNPPPYKHKNPYLSVSFFRNQVHIREPAHAQRRTWGAAGAKCERPRPGPDINTTTWTTTYKIVGSPPEAERAKKSGDLGQGCFLYGDCRLCSASVVSSNTPIDQIFSGYAVPWGFWGWGLGRGCTHIDFQNPVFTSPSVSLFLFVSVSVCLCVSVCVCLSVMTESFNSDRADDNRLIR